MNRELISRLYIEAVDHAVLQPLNEDGSHKAWVWEEKFIELLVTECAKVIEDSKWNLPRGCTAKEQAEYLKEHFGMK